MFAELKELKIAELKELKIEVFRISAVALRRK